MNDFISDEDLSTFEGFLAYHGRHSFPEDLGMWRRIFDEATERREASPKVGLMKLQPIVGEQKYAVAIRDGSDLWLTLWVRCSRKGEVFIMYPRGDGDLDAHASYHLDGTFHQKGYGAVLATQKRQRLTVPFSGSEHLGLYSGHGTKSIGAICSPEIFNGVVIVEPGILGPRHGVVAVELVEAGCEPTTFPGTQSVRGIFPRDGRPTVVITIGQATLE